MAHRIIYTPPDIILSSSIGEIEIAVDGNFVDVSLTATAGTVILCERYYAFQGYVRIHDLSSLIEHQMREAGDTISDFRLSAYTDTPGNKADSKTLHILYCDRYCLCSDIPMFLRENFLTTNSMRRVCADTDSLSAISLFFYAEKGESLEYTVFHRFRVKDSDAIFSHSYTMDYGKTATASGIYQIDISLEDVIADGASFAPAPLQNVTPLSLTLSCGQRSATVFVDPALDAMQTFFYRNCFNVWEFLTLPVTTTSKTDIEKATAIINGKSEFYDRNITKTYECETGPLTSDEADCMDMLLTSHEVMRIEHNPFDDTDPYMLVPVIITDSDCQISDSDENPNTIKFSWRFADNRPILRLPASPGIFSSPFNPVFS